MSQIEPSRTVNKPVLVFPGGMPRSLEYLQKCLRDEQAVIGASSLDYDVSQERYPAWIHLPYVTQPEFNAALKQAILRYDIGGIFSPNPVVWNQLSRTLGEIAPGVALVNDSPVNAELSSYRTAQVQAREIIDRPLPLASESPAKPAISEIELAALIRHADLIPGMCDREKLCALCEIARHTPRGDIVEIGSWWGKSACIFARLARCYAIGNLLCVDPWTNELIVSKDADAMVDAAFAQVDAEEAFRVFQIGLLPYSFNHINYLRMTSVEGAQYYGRQRSVSTEAFGRTEYAGHIAVLHIDGNHAYESANADIESWGKFVIPGGWIIFDDYVWPYGNGPQRAGDEFLESNRSRISTSFVMGSALFVQLTLRDTSSIVR